MSNSIYVIDQIKYNKVMIESLSYKLRVLESQNKTLKKRIFELEDRFNRMITK